MNGLDHQQLLELGYGELKRNPEQAFQALQARLKPLGFHATLTHCWLGLISLGLEQGCDLPELRRRLGFSQLPLGHYSCALLNSAAAEGTALEPDLRPLCLPRELPDALLQPLLAFQARTLSPEQWTHEAHLTVAAALFALLGPWGIQAMTGGIQRLNAVHQVPQTPERGYHETLTRLWYQLVALEVERLALPDHPERLGQLLEALSDRQLPLRYYRRETLKSWEARTQWVPPDRLRLEMFTTA